MTALQSYQTIRILWNKWTCIR